MRHYTRLAEIAGWVLLSSGAIAPFASAQIVPDTTLPINTIVTPAGQVYTITGGTERGVNLYHSFREFSIPPGGAAFFNNGLQIQNILTRVTGTSLSNIDGLLRANGTANLFLLNPNGIVFGPNARLQLGGSFFATTANSLKFSDGSEFSAVNPQAPPLLAVNVAPGVQYGKAVGDITQVGNLAVPAGQTLALYGNAVTNIGTLTAPGGTIQVLGDRVALVGPTQIDVSGTGDGGTVRIGGDYQGNGSLPVATRTFVDYGAIIRANGGERGNGGNVVVWSSEATGFGGQISARGGTSAGNGGSVAVSSLGSLQYQGRINNREGIDVAAPQGVPGAVLFNSKNITIGAVDGDPFDLNNTFSPTPNVSVTFDANQLPTSGNIVLQASNDITVNQPLILFTTNGLTLQAGRSILINQSLGKFGQNGLTLLANQGTATGVVDSQRDPGVAVIQVVPTAQVFAQNDILIQLGSGDGLTNNRGGDITLNGVSSITGSVNVENQAPNGSIIASDVGVARFPQDEIPGIALTAKGNIQLSNATLFPGIALNAGGDVTVTNVNSNFGNLTIGAGGSINVSNGFYARRASNFTAGLDVTLRDISISFGSLTAIAGRNIIANSISGGGTGAGGGSLVFQAGGTIQAGNIRTLNRSITLDAQDAIDAENVNSNSGSAGSSRAGDIVLRSQSSINARNIRSTAQESTDGSFVTAGSGSISLDAVGNITSSNLSTVSDFKSGSIQLISRNGSIDTTAGNLVSQANTNGGDITLQAAGDIRVGSLIASSITDGGKIEISTPETFSAANRLISTATQQSGKSGDISITAKSVALTDGTQVSASAAGKATGGNVSIQAKDFVLVEGNTSMPSSIITQTTGEGSAGSVSIRTRRLIEDQGRIAVTTFSAGNAGNITIQADDSASLANGSVLLANTESNSTGTGGSITVTANSLQAFNGAQIAATTAGSGKAGDVILNIGDRLFLSDPGTGLFASTTTGSTGNGGNITIDPRQVLIQDGATIAVNSEGSGTGGSIFLQADRLELRNRGSITAETASTQGGNITLNLSDVLLLRRNSLISATAGTAQSDGNGGNVTITAPFVIGVLAENSDIRANAFRGNGGNVTINANQVFGLRPQPQDTPFSDITASSALGISGSIVLNTLNLDPTQGLQELNLTPLDPSKLVVQGCNSGRRVVEGQSRFVVLGRGGLSASPDDWFGGTPILNDLGSPVASSTSSVPAPSHVAASTTDEIVEAQGWVKGADGEIYLVQQPVNAPLRRGQWLPTQCQGF